MAKTIIQKVVFKNTTPEALYDLYMNAKKHSDSTGGPTKISNREGTKFSAGGDYITGKNLKLVNGNTIVQSWRASEWDKDEPDSIFILQLEKKGKDAVLNMVHAFVPDKHAEGVKKGWTSYYWDKWKMYLAGKPIPKMGM